MIQIQLTFLTKSIIFFNQFQSAASLHQCGIRKRHGHSVHTLILAIFTLPFMGENFFRGIATNGNLAFGKDVAMAPALQYSGLLEKRKLADKF